MMLKKVFAFLKKDFITESSYKLAFIFNFTGVLFSILAYYFIDRLFGYKIVGHLQEFGVNYFAYVLLSMAFFSYTGVGLGSFATRIRYEQVQGTLEAVMLTPTKISVILLSLGFWNLILATLDMLIYMCLGIFMFGIDFTKMNVLSTMVILFLTITSFSGLGIISASFILVFKRGNPVSWIISSLEGLIGGVYFPISVLPAWLAFLARFLPITYAIRAIQLAVYRGFSLAQLAKEIVFLLLFTVFLLPLSLALFKHALKRARTNGSLSQY